MKNNTSKKHQYVVFNIRLRRFHNLSSDEQYAIGKKVWVKYNKKNYPSTVCYIKP